MDEKLKELNALMDKMMAGMKDLQDRIKALERPDASEVEVEEKAESTGDGTVLDNVIQGSQGPASIWRAPVVKGQSDSCFDNVMGMPPQK